MLLLSLPILFPSQAGAQLTLAVTPASPGYAAAFDLALELA